MDHISPKYMCEKWKNSLSCHHLVFLSWFNMIPRYLGSIIPYVTQPNPGFFFIAHLGSWWISTTSIFHWGLGVRTSWFSTSHLAMGFPKRPMKHVAHANPYDRNVAVPWSGWETRRKWRNTGKLDIGEMDAFHTLSRKMNEKVPPKKGTFFLREWIINLPSFFDFREFWAGYFSWHGNTWLWCWLCTQSCREQIRI